MMGENIDRELVKRLIPTGLCNQYDYISLNLNSDNIEIDLLSKYDCYCDLFVCADSQSSYIVKVDDVIVCSNTICNHIPIFISKNSKLNIVGTSKKIILGITNAKFGFEVKKSVLSLNNIVLEKLGTTINLFSFDDENSLINGDFDFVEKLNNTYYVQSFISNNNIYIGKIILEDNNAYICTSIDNYTNKILIDFDVDDAIFIQDFANNNTIIAYISNYKLYYKIWDNNDTVSDAIELNCGDFMPKSFVFNEIENSDNCECLFGVFDLCGVTKFFKFCNNTFEFILQTSEKIDFCIISNDNFYLVSKNNSVIKMYVYDFDNLYVCLNKFVKNNIIDSFVYNSKLICYSFDMKGTVFDL